MTIAVYPGSFDPITNGHIDVAVRAAHIFETVILAVYDRPLKNLLFPTKKRLELVREAVAGIPNIKVDSYSELTVNYAHKMGATVIVRGMRAATDFEREFQMAHINHLLCPHVEVVCLMASQRYSFLSSSAVKEIAQLGADLSNFVPPHVERALREAYGQRQEGQT
ncbi:MAG: phosphopantetheine adenylyltransferase [Herpetosiphonaceae bacterium]|nr:MAG: phosphopantetheine adenylyltransferase [Herpetosiphonaceae bacterium]